MTLRGDATIESQTEPRLGPPEQLREEAEDREGAEVLARQAADYGRLLGCSTGCGRMAWTRMVRRRPDGNDPRA